MQQGGDGASGHKLQKHIQSHSRLCPRLRLLLLLLVLLVPVVSGDWLSRSSDVALQGSHGEEEEDTGVIYRDLWENTHSEQGLQL